MKRAGFAARSCGNSRFLSVARRNYSVSFHQPPKSMSPMLPFSLRVVPSVHTMSTARGESTI